MRRSSAAGLTAVLLVALATAAAAAAATLAAADGLDADQRRLLGVSMLPNGTEISEPYVPSPPAQDIPLDDGPWARTAVGWEPEGIHLSLWSKESVLVSWQTGEPRIGPTSNPPVPYDAAEVAGRVRWGTAPGQLVQTASEGGKDVVYSYSYKKEAGGMTYQSPIIHHQLLKGLQPGQRYYYSVGGQHPNGTATPDSPELSFRMPASPPTPLRLGVMGDPGQTYNTSAMLEQLAAQEPDLVLILGDYSYADLYMSNATSDTTWAFQPVPTSQQLRWDSWARLTEPLLSTVPALHVGGNHEVERLPDGSTFTSFNARYPVPQDTGAIITAPNNASLYLNASNSKQFVNQTSYEPRSAFYTVTVPGIVTFVVINNYLPTVPGSRQYEWAGKQLAAVDRNNTPWLVFLMHGAPRTTFTPSFGLFKELEEFMASWEPLLYQAQVDLVLSGHVHSYERSYPQYQYELDPCGPAYIVAGGGGNTEDPEFHTADELPAEYCFNTSLYVQPSYQPTSSGGPTLTFYPDGEFCPASQPAYSAFRDPSFGHVLLVLQNSSHAELTYWRTQDGGAALADEAMLVRTLDCPAKLSAPAGRQGKQASGASSVAGGVLALAAAAAVGWVLLADDE